MTSDVLFKQSAGHLSHNSHPLLFKEIIQDSCYFFPSTEISTFRSTSTDFLLYRKRYSVFDSISFKTSSTDTFLDLMKV